MVGRFIRVFNKELVNINHAAFFLGLFAFLSQVLGLFRDRALAHIVGPGATLDIYYAAFRAPDLVYIIFGSIVSVVVIMPYLTKLVSSEDKSLSEQGMAFLSSIYSAFLIGIICISVLGMVFMPFIASIVAPGFSESEAATLVSVGRIMFLSPIFLGLSSLFGSVAQTFKRFVVFALSPFFYNIGILVGIIFLYPLFGISGLMYGVILGSVLHFGVQWISVRASHNAPSFIIRTIEWKLVKEVTLSSIPRTLGLVLTNIAIVVLLAIASFFSDGVISIFNLSFNIQALTLSVIGVSYAVAAFPALTRYFAEKNREQFFHHLATVVRQIFFWTLPVTVLFIVVRAQIVRVILGSGSFSWNDTRLAAATLACFALSIPAQSIVALFMRAYYASGNIRRPLYIAAISSITIIFVAVGLVYAFEHILSFRVWIEHLMRVEGIPGTEVMMLALAYSVGITLNALLLWQYLKKDFNYRAEFRSLEKSAIQHVIAAIISGVTAYMSLSIVSSLISLSTFWAIFIQGFVAGTLGIVYGCLFLYAIKNEELLGLLKSLQSKWKKSDVVPVEPLFDERLDF